jgi:hypothetical protein
LTFSGDTNTGIFSPAADTIAFTEGGVESMRIDSAGNLGLGVTPSAWSLITPMQIKNASFAGYLNRAYVFANSYFDGSNNKYIASDHATYYSQQSGQHQWYNAASGTAGNNISFTQAMTLDASGNLGIGATSLTRKIQVDAIPAAGNQLNGLRLQMVGVSTSISEFLLGTDGGGVPFTSLRTGNDSNSYMTFATGSGPTERARIDASGNLMVDQTLSTDARTYLRSTSDTFNALCVDRASSSNGIAVRMRRNGSTVGSIDVTTTATSYVTSSDYRLKEDVQPMTGALAKVQALKPVTYKWKADGSDGQGFIAHELQEVVPECVTGEKDAVNEDGSIKPQGIDTSFLVATLTAAIQELKAELDATKAEVALLKGAA